MANLTQVTLASGVPQDSGTVSTIDALLAIIATAAKQDTGNTSLASILTKLADPATQTTLAAVLAKLTSDPATQTTLAAALATLGSTSGAAVVTDANGTAQQYLRGLVKLIAAGINVVITNANANGQAAMAASAPVVIASNQSSIPVAATTVDPYSQYETVASSQTAQVMGAGGATGDYLAGVLVFPGTAGCGVVTIMDNATTIGTFAGGGTTALPSLVPFMIPVGLFSVSGAWKITTGANVTAVGVGKFT